mmetsp:Transcript_40112/g.94279  ORF Transcript_40112/g.94279 Transcript_40112/m.94279 type:complete len:226 (-) Transcript_40112:666-1343(-)
MLLRRLGLIHLLLLPQRLLAHPPHVVRAPHLPVAGSSDGHALKGSLALHPALQDRRRHLLRLASLSAKRRKVLLHAAVLIGEVGGLKLPFRDPARARHVGPDVTELVVHALLDVAALAEEVPLLVLRKRHAPEAGTRLELAGALAEDDFPVLGRLVPVRLELRVRLLEHGRVQHILHRNRCLPEPVHSGGREHEVDALGREARLVERYACGSDRDPFKAIHNARE